MTIIWPTVHAVLFSAFVLPILLLVKYPVIFLLLSAANAQHNEDKVGFHLGSENPTNAYMQLVIKALKQQIIKVRTINELVVCRMMPLSLPTCILMSSRLLWSKSVLLFASFSYAWSNSDLQNKTFQENFINKYGKIHK